MERERGEIFTIVSGKGGVGKTNLAVNLGILLSRQGLRPVLVDADLGMANADLLLNLSPVGDLYAALDESRPIAATLTAGPAGLRVLCGVSGPARNGHNGALSPGQCTRLLGRLAREADVLLIDCGSGLSATVESLALATDRLIIVTTPEPTALTDAYAVLKLLHLRGLSAQVALVVNMTINAREGPRIAQRMQRAAAQFLGLQIAYLGDVRHDAHVVRAVRQRTPLVLRYPRCVAAACLSVLSQRLAPCPFGDAGIGTWTRVASLFL